MGEIVELGRYMIQVCTLDSGDQYLDVGGDNTIYLYASKELAQKALESIMRKDSNVVDGQIIEIMRR
jgi:hypothetical protein